MKLTKEQCRDILAKQVGDQLAYEMSKPFRKINWEIVEMCEHVFEIIYPEYMLTDEEIPNGYKQLRKVGSLYRRNNRQAHQSETHKGFSGSMPSASQNTR